MLQRVQSVYLFVVFVFAILFATIPVAQFSIDTVDHSLRLIQYKAFFDQTAFAGNRIGILLIISWFTIFILTVYMTFQFKKRLFQIKLGKINILLHVFVVMLTFFFIDNLRNQVENTEFNYGAGVLFPVISLIFILMAIKAIKRDEALVRSADRFR